jgi:hypothetical protein
MSEDREEQSMAAESAEFKRGFAAGLNSAAEKESPAGASLDQELSKAPAISNDRSTPLFLSDSPEGDKGNAQDEKDETAE